MSYAHYFRMLPRASTTRDWNNALMFSRRPFESLRQVKRLTHIPPALQADFTPEYCSCVLNYGHSPSVTAPSEALLTCLAYLANAPRRA